MDMTGKTVMITGAGRIFANAGANVVLLARSGNSIRALADEIGQTAMAVTCDVADYAQVEAAVQASVKRFGALLWMCSPDADEFIGSEISLRDEGIRKRAGLI